MLSTKEIILQSNIKIEQENQKHLNTNSSPKQHQLQQFSKQVIKQSEIQEQKKLEDADALVEPENLEQQNLLIPESLNDTELKDKEEELLSQKKKVLESINLKENQESIQRLKELLQ